MEVREQKGGGAESFVPPTHLELRCVGAGGPRLLRGQDSLFPPAGRHLGLLGLGRLRVDRLEELGTETDAGPGEVTEVT